MKRVIVREFGGPEMLEVVEEPTPEPGPGQVRVRLTSIGMNHADLMARRGDYKLSSGDAPFTPGLEGGGVIEAVGDGVSKERLGERVTLSPSAPRRDNDNQGGTYASHYVCRAELALVAPDAVPDEQLGALWLSYLTAWGCLVWKQQVRTGQVVAMPAASSAVALAAGQIVKKLGGVSIGLTTSPEKVDELKSLQPASYDHLIVTHEPDRAMKAWHRDIKQAIGGRGVHVFFDPVAAGDYLSTEIRCLAPYGVIWVYGLLGRPGAVDVTPLIRKRAAIRGWTMAEVSDVEAVWRKGCAEIFAGFADGSYAQPLAGTFKLSEVARAHDEMEKGRHLGKLVLVPD